MKPKKKRKLFFPKAALKIASKKPWKPVRWNVSIGRRIEKVLL
jgi:ribosomal protein L22